MKLEKLSQIWKNDYIQMIFLSIILFGGVFAFWFGLRLGFQTEFPVLAVASGSMEPTYYRGDLIIVQGISNFSELHVGLYKLPNGTLTSTPGEAIVYYHPGYGRPPPISLPIAGTEAYLIVHRAVEKYQLENGTWYFETKGDANPGSRYDPWGPIRQDYIVGKVVGKVPLVGHIPLFMHENSILAISIIGFLIVVLFLMDFIFPEKKDEKNRGQEEKSLNSTISKNRVPKNR